MLYLKSVRWITVQMHFLDAPSIDSKENFENYPEYKHL